STECDVDPVRSEGTAFHLAPPRFKRPTPVAARCAQSYVRNRADQIRHGPEASVVIDRREYGELRIAQATTPPILRQHPAGEHGAENETSRGLAPEPSQSFLVGHAERESPAEGMVADARQVAQSAVDVLGPDADPLLSIAGQRLR